MKLIIHIHLEASLKLGADKLHFPIRLHYMHMGIFFSDLKVIPVLAEKKLCDTITMNPVSGICHLMLF
jgi:hypothetical protein